jgi:hypothetical protein
MHMSEINVMWESLGPTFAITGRVTNMYTNLTSECLKLGGYVPLEGTHGT